MPRKPRMPPIDIAELKSHSPRAEVRGPRRCGIGWINAETKERLATNALARVAGTALGTVSLSLRWII